MEKEVRYKKVDLTFEQKKNLDKPIVRQLGPYAIKGMVPGKRYSYCTCGLSAKDPFCDGAHKGSKYKSIKFIAGDEEVNYLCGCKHNKGEKNVYCDGSHNECGAVPVEEVF